jgi:hypothetical protein
MVNEANSTYYSGYIVTLCRNGVGRPDAGTPEAGRREDRMRTVTTWEAQGAASLMAGRLPGLRATTTKLLVFGNTLADPASWDGPRAAWFRSWVWPDVETSLLTLHRDLTGLTGSIAHVDGRILTVGG